MTGSALIQLHGQTDSSLSQLGGTGSIIFRGVTALIKVLHSAPLRSLYVPALDAANHGPGTSGEGGQGVADPL